jgi:predicted RNA-binding protein YlxR (DUF448 family)
MLQPEGSRVRVPMSSMNYFNLITPSNRTIGPGVYLSSNRNEYQKQKKMFLGSRARSMRRAHNLAGEPIV